MDNHLYKLVVVITMILTVTSTSCHAATFTPTIQPGKWIVRNAGSVALTGETQMGETTASGYEFVFGEGDNAFLSAIAPYAASFPALPASGWLKAGDIYNYNGQAVIVRQSHNRTADAPASVPALFSVYRTGVVGTLDWIPNEPVTVGMQRVYLGSTYKCIQAHTTQIDWTPPFAPSLWAVVVPPSANWAVGVAYKIGDHVMYQGHEYTCLQAHTSQATWTPAAVPALWKIVP